MMKLTQTVLILLLLMSNAAMAYIGPAAGIPIIGSVVGFFVTIALIIAAILFWPIRKLLKKRKKQSGEDS